MTEGEQKRRTLLFRLSSCHGIRAQPGAGVFLSRRERDLDRYMDLGKATLFEGTKKIKENKLKVLVVWLLWMWLALCRHVAPGCWGRARRP